MYPQSRNLLIIGAGQYGLVAQEIALAMDIFDEIAFVDDSFPECHPRAGGAPATIGTTLDIAKFANEFNFGFVAIGNSDVRRRLTEQLRENGLTPATLVHPQAYVSPSARLKEGCCVEPLAAVQTDARLGTATFVASGAVVRHNATVGEFCHVDCNAVVESSAVVPPATKVPCNSVYRRD